MNKKASLEAFFVLYYHRGVRGTGTLTPVLPAESQKRNALTGPGRGVIQRVEMTRNPSQYR